MNIPKRQDPKVTHASFELLATERAVGLINQVLVRRGIDLERASNAHTANLNDQPGSLNTRYIALAGIGVLSTAISSYFLGSNVAQHNTEHALADAGMAAAGGLGVTSSIGQMLWNQRIVTRIVREQERRTAEVLHGLGLPGARRLQECSDETLQNAGRQVLDQLSTAICKLGTATGSEYDHGQAHDVAMTNAIQAATFKRTLSLHM